MRYPDTVNLPFNAQVIEHEFVRGLPGDAVPASDAVYAVIQGNSLLVERGCDGLMLPRELPAGWLKDGCAPLYLGRWCDRPVFALRAGKDISVQSPFSAEPFNATGENLDDRLLTIGGLAQQVLYWEGISRICGRCGGQVEWIPGSWGRRCNGCRHERFPAIHPCAIVLVRRGEEFLFVRKAEWVPGRYSLVAGFLDFGESLEECAGREVLEETGIYVKNVRYVGSQCWPFPSQLMAGFVSEYAGGEIAVDRNEIDDARWFTRENLPDSFPPYRSIARWIIENFCLGRNDIQPPLE